MKILTTHMKQALASKADLEADPVCGGPEGRGVVSGSSRMC